MADVMKGKPILFSAPMVRALLAGKKTQTRRVMPSAHPKFPEFNFLNPDLLVDKREVWFWDGIYQGVGASYRLPYATGDRLWVREAWRAEHRFDDLPPRDIPPGENIQYLADDPISPWDARYRHARFMPRWASRLTPTVTDVRVQRLQEISEADAMAEGAESRPECSGFLGRDNGWSMDWSRIGEMSAYASRPPGGPAKAPLSAKDISLCDAEMAFASFWNSLHGAGAWDANPWVMAVTFTVAHCNIDQMEAPNA